MTSRTPIKIVRRALWKPAWYKLDQSIGVGQYGRFAFFGPKVRECDPWGDAYDLVFFNQLDSPENRAQFRLARVLEIIHPALGNIERVDTAGMDYIFYPANGSEVVVNAEEEPGVIYDYDQEIADWSMTVTLGEISDPLNDSAF